MRAIDTNVVVRYLTGDHPEQSPKAKAFLEAGDIFVPTTVLLEAEWVLRGVYGFARSDVVASLRAFSALPGVTPEHPAHIAKALDWASDGMDFADALHLAKSLGCEAMASLDRKFAKTARKAGAQIPVRSL